MQVVYSQEAPPQTFSRSIFLAGPTPREKSVQSWRPEALRLLESNGFDGVVFVPEVRSGEWKHSYTEQIEWEESCLHMSDCVLFWIPRDLETMPGFTTNTEWGVWQDTGRVVFGAPDDAPKTRYQRHYARELQVPTDTTLKGTVGAALALVEKGGDTGQRKGGEREVPIQIWRTPNFQAWYQAQVGAGNRLDGARVEWCFRVGPARSFLLFWAIHVKIWVSAEGRYKSNEVVLSRPDISSIVAYRLAENLMDTEVVLVREFRSPARTKDGFIRECPGGSSFKETESALQLAAWELREETGLEVAPSRFVEIKSRQALGTLSTHHVHLFSVSLTEGEIESLRGQRGKAFGVEGETERTYVEVTRLGDLLDAGTVDWATLGMILSTLTRRYAG